MKSLSDKIEDYLKQLLNKNSNIRIRRTNLSKKFNCVPSQINYVLNTRFTFEKGYVIESQRGGGGYIKISKIQLSNKKEIISQLSKNIGERITQLEAFNIIDRLYESEIIASFEKDLLKSTVHRKAIRVEPPIRDIIRAGILRNVLKTVIKRGD